MRAALCICKKLLWLWAVNVIESNIRGIHQDQPPRDSNSDQRRSTVQAGFLNNSKPAQVLQISKKPPVGIDKFTTCSSTVRYSGRRAVSAVHRPESDVLQAGLENYNATVEFLWAPLLVESNSDDAVDHRMSERILRPDSILRHSSQWEHADILVFNSFLWWRQGPVKLLNWWAGGMELAMECWADWVASNVDPLKKKVFFVTMSPTHQLKEEWEPGSEGNCYDEKQPIHDERYRGSASDLPTMRMVEKVFSRLGSKVFVLNITQLSDYRKDGHPTIYRKFWESFSPEKLANPASYSDCTHWCLPGVPDVWNELLFQFL
ncbi:protein trichome birefringence-like 35 [Sesamum angolense]|uniref:Protein trichome birefringence-like 35 n=1 Tax=Sesamum angolense TaxID=2727404 RepID=A0AAE2BSF2_9LAMI|nr:protein trichome birefringence-like 35 [Sesamum angolense]